METKMTRPDRIRTTMAGLATALLLTGLADGAAAQTFRYGSFVPERSSANQKGVFPLEKKITAATGGRVKFTNLVGGTVLTPRNTISGIRDKVVDAGFMVSQFHTSELPYASLLAGFTGFGTETFATLGALNEAYFIACPKCREDFAKLGIMPLFAQSATPLNMVCRKTVAGMADLKGLRMSAIGATELRWGALLGMTPRRQNFRQFVQAMQLGQTDCFMGPPAWIVSYGLTDVAKSVVTMPQGVIVGAYPMVFNKASFDRISAADKKALVANMAGWAFDYVKGAYVDGDVAARKALDGKVSFVAGGKAMQEKWLAFRKSEIAALVKLAESRKLENPEKLVTTIAGIFAKWHTEYLPDFKGDRATFVKVLNERVFSKVSY